MFETLIVENLDSQRTMRFSEYANEPYCLGRSFFFLLLIRFERIRAIFQCKIQNPYEAYNLVANKNIATANNQYS